jgi:hypothetical protein
MVGAYEAWERAKPDNSLRYDLRVRLTDASNGNIDPLSDISPGSHRVATSKGH